MLGITNAINITPKGGTIDNNTMFLFTDSLTEKTGNYTFTNNSVTVDSSNKRDSRNTLKFSGSANLVCTSIANTTLAKALAGFNPWTVEYWFYLTTSVTSSCIVHFKNIASNNYGIIIGHTGGQTNGDMYISNNSSSWNIYSNQKLWASVATGAWHHYAVVREDWGAFRAYVDGVCTWAGTVCVYALEIPTALVSIGAQYVTNNDTPTYKIKGNLQDIRFSNCVRYHANFTPPQKLL